MENLNKEDERVRDFFGDSGEQDHVVLEELIASWCRSKTKLGIGFGDGVFGSSRLNDFVALLKRMAKKYDSEVPVSACRRAFASDSIEVQEAFERHYQEGRIGRMAEALGIKIKE